MNFEEEDEDVEEVEVEKTPKRSVHGRQATSFVPKSKARVGQAGRSKTREGLRNIWRRLASMKLRNSSTQRTVKKMAKTHPKDPPNLGKPQPSSQSQEQQRVSPPQHGHMCSSLCDLPCLR